MAPLSTGPAAAPSALARGALWVFLTTALAAAVAWGSQGLAARLVPWAWEVRLGETVALQAMGKPCEAKSGPGQAALAAIVQRLYPQSAAERGMPVRVSVVNNPDINAFATLGGRITVLSGLIAEAKSPEELAGVLAHELEHVAQRHLVEHVAQGMLLEASIALLIKGDSTLGETMRHAEYWGKLQFSRHAESQADKGALCRLARAHISPTGLANFFKRQHEHGTLPAWLSDHPSDRDRVQMLQAAAQAPTVPILDDAAWQALKQMCR